jgi:hypothetical protein
MSKGHVERESTQVRITQKLENKMENSYRKNEEISDERNNINKRKLN